VRTPYRFEHGIILLRTARRRVYFMCNRTDYKCDRNTETACATLRAYADRNRTTAKSFYVGSRNAGKIYDFVGQTIIHRKSKRKSGANNTLSWDGKKTYWQKTNKTHPVIFIFIRPCGLMSVDNDNIAICSDITISIYNITG